VSRPGTGQRVTSAAAAGVKKALGLQPAPRAGRGAGHYLVAFAAPLGAVAFFALLAVALSQKVVLKGHLLSSAWEESAHLHKRLYIWAKVTTPVHVCYGHEPFTKKMTSALTWRVLHQIGAWPAGGTGGFVQLPMRDDYSGGGSGGLGEPRGSGKGERLEDPAEVKVPICPN
jgi:hypothetical protein